MEYQIKTVSFYVNVINIIRKPLVVALINGGTCVWGSSTLQGASVDMSKNKINMDAIKTRCSGTSRCERVNRHKLAHCLKHSHWSVRGWTIILSSLIGGLITLTLSPPLLFCLVINRRSVNRKQWTSTWITNRHKLAHCLKHSHWSVRGWTIILSSLIGGLITLTLSPPLLFCLVINRRSVNRKQWTSTWITKVQ